MLVDAYGNPLKTKDIQEPQTARIAALAHALPESQLRGLSPQKAGRMLADADSGDVTAQSMLFDDMLDRDAHLSAEMGKRTGAVCATNWFLRAPRDASKAEIKATEMVEDLLREAVDDLEDVILHLGEGAGHGFSVIELEWKFEGGVWLPRFHPRPQWWCVYNTTAHELRVSDGSAEGALFRPLNWIRHEHKKAKTGYLGRVGILRACVWPFLYKSYGIGDFAEFLQVYGLPMVLGKYFAGASDDEKASLLSAVASLSSNARAIMPEGMAVEVMQVTASGRGASPHLAMADWADRAFSKAVLGQILSAEAHATGLGSGVANLHAAVRRDILLADCRQIAGTLDRDLIYPLVLLNAPGVDAWKRCPRWQFDLAEKEDLSVYADALPKLVAVGAKIPAGWVSEKLGIPAPEKDEPVLGLQPDTPPKSTLTALKATQAQEPLPPSQQAVKSHLEAAQAQIDIWLARIAGLVESAQSLEQLHAMILAAYNDLPEEELALAIQSATLVANLAGQFDAREESCGK